MSFKVTDDMGISARGIIAVMLLSSFVNSQQGDLTCQRNWFHVSVCPQHTNPPTNRNQQQCEDDGCYYCSSHPTPCIEGLGCAISDVTPDDECFDANGFRIFHRTACRKRGCSWCENHPGFKCFKNPTSQNDIIIPPPSSFENCLNLAQRVECDYLIPARKMMPTNCWLSGCHWCATSVNITDPTCIQGKVCSTSKSTGDYDCRNHPTEVLSRFECLKRGCSWCPNNAAFQCVRDTPVGISDLTCRRNVADYIECPSYTGGPTVRNEQQCRDDGCYYCNSLTTKCVLGTGCSWINMVTANECKTSSGNTISNRKVCRDQGCSWCEHHTGIKCFKNAATAAEVVSAPPPYPAACSASARVQCSYLQPMYGGSAPQCWLSGCHWCPATNQPSCIQGEVCAMQRSGGEYDCRDTPTESLSPYECIQRGCSWCAANTAYKCVRNLPDTPLAECPGLLHCFSSPVLFGVTEAQCNNQYRCSYCNVTDPTKTCMRDSCPPGYELRQGGGSCCRSMTTLPAGVEPPRIARIINGDVVAENDFPWIVYYQFVILGVATSACGGFVVAPKIVITAAHCQIRDPLTRIIIGPGIGFVNAGTRDLRTGQSIPVAEAIPHPWYSDALTLHDVMILKLWNEVPSQVTPIQLPMGETPIVGTNCFVAGYGVTNTTVVPPIASTILLQATATIFSTATCRNNSFIPFDDKFLICAGGNGQSACFGDSGGALMCQRCSSCDWYAAGIVSFGVDAACTPGFPTYYAKVDAYQAFFKDNSVPIGSQKYTCDI